MTDMRMLMLVAGTFLTLAAWAKPMRFGCAYYPEVWPEERWAQDLDDMKAAGLSAIRIGEFNWGNFEPEEGKFDFTSYRRLLALCEQKGMDVMMCTPTAAIPLWMHRLYPECEKRTPSGERPGLGARQNACPSSGKFRFFSKRIAEKMAEAFKDFPCIKWWQVDNELHIHGGTGLCACPSCVTGFRAWMKRRYGTLEELNRAWNSAFWSSRFSSWEDVTYPIQTCREPWMTEYVRYQSDAYVAFALEQREAIGRRCPQATVTANGCEMSGWIRLDELYAGLGSAAVDTYVDNQFKDRAPWMWNLSRGITGCQKPFTVAEMGPFTWNADETDGDEKVLGWVRNAARHGAELLMFFRWRQSVNGEQYHPAILPWSGKKGRGYELVKRITSAGIETEMPASGVAILHSNESDQDTLVRGQNVQFGQYEDTSIALNAALERRGILADYLPSGPEVDFSPYRFVFVPVNTIVPQPVIDKLKDYVKQGGTVLAICRLNLLDPKGGSYRTESYPVGMKDLFGLEINEQRGWTEWKFAYDLVEPKGCATLLKLDEGVFAGAPALTRNAYGRGRAYYYAKLPTSASEIDRLLDLTLEDGIAQHVPNESAGLVVTRSPARLTEADAAPCSPNDAVRYGAVLPLQIGPGTVAYVVNRVVCPASTNGLARWQGTPTDGADLVTAGEVERTVAVSRSVVEDGRFAVRGVSCGGFVPLGARLAGVPHPQAGTGFLVGTVRTDAASGSQLEVRGIGFDGKAVSVASAEVYSPDRPLRIGTGPWAVASVGVGVALSDGADLLLSVVARNRDAGAVAVGVSRWCRRESGWSPVSFVQVAPIAETAAISARPSLVRDFAGRLVLMARTSGLVLWSSADGGKNWKAWTSVTDSCAAGDATVGRTTDGRIFVAACSAEGTLTVWPVSSDGRVGVGEIARDAQTEFGAEAQWRVANPVSAVLRSADGGLRSVLGYRIGEPDDRMTAHWRTGAYLEDVKTTEDAVQLWDFATPTVRESGKLTSIVDRIENAGKYRSLGKWMPAALSFLQRKDLATMPTGTYDIVPGKCWAYVSVVTLEKLRDEYLYEAHRRFFDIQAPLSGPETMGLLPLPKAPIDPFNEKGDYVLFHARGGERTLQPGEFVILPPPDGCHAPGFAADGPVAGHRKVIIKVLAE